MKKQEEKKELDKYIESMHQSFSTMLKKTLEKMKDRIQKAHNAWDDENKPSMSNKFRDIIDNGQ